MRSSAVSAESVSQSTQPGIACARVIEAGDDAQSIAVGAASGDLQRDFRIAGRDGRGKASALRRKPQLLCHILAQGRVMTLNGAPGFNRTA